MANSNVVDIINLLVSASNEPGVSNFNASVRLKLSELRDVEVTVKSCDNLSESHVDVLNHRVQHIEGVANHREREEDRACHSVEGVANRREREEDRACHSVEGVANHREREKDRAGHSVNIRRSGRKR